MESIQSARSKAASSGRQRSCTDWQENRSRVASTKWLQRWNTYSVIPNEQCSHEAKKLELWTTCR
ncbi:MAG: hypothetical protein VYC72_02065, partial [Verrucomicrobiota bacterium]|nr:hypothetical protein [Verrucomicrobiota bacterium]